MVELSSVSPRSKFSVLLIFASSFLPIAPSVEVAFGLSCCCFDVSIVGVFGGMWLCSGGWYD